MGLSQMLMSKQVVQKKLLEKVVQDESAHARFLNTLSIIELCGAKRIAFALSHLQATTFILEHAAEEFRHAFFLRHLANKICNSINFDEYLNDNLYCPRQSRLYVSNLYRRICLLLNRNKIKTPKDMHFYSYLLATYALEKRALPFYRLYQSVIDDYGIALSLKSIISEEQSHLREIKDLLLHASVGKELIGQSIHIEGQIFSNWWLCLSSAID